jgi:hypothetical protein
MITLTATAMVVINVDCEHAQTQAHLIPPPGLDMDERALVLEEAKRAALDLHRHESPECDCLLAPDPAKDRLN